jgi:hypothetical protein
MRGKSYLLLLALLLVRANDGRGDATLGINFQGLAQSSLASTNVAPPDPSGTIGPTHFAEFVNGGFATFNKSTGIQTAVVSDQQFWLNAGLSASIFGAGVARPHVVFDWNTNRWIGTEITTDNQDNRILLAVSKGPNPEPTAGNWSAVSFTANPAATAGTSTYRYADYPQLGLDANAVYISTLNFTARQGATDDSVSLFSIPKSDLTASNPSLAHISTFFGTNGNTNDLGFVLQPMIDMTRSKAARAAMFAINNADAAMLNRTDLVGTSSSAATLAMTQSMSVQSTQFPVRPRQPDGTGHPSPTKGLDALDDRLASAYQVGSRVYLVRDIGQPSSNATHNAIRWSVLDVSNESATKVLQEGTIEDSNFDFFRPSIAVNGLGDVVIGYNRSGPGSPINSYVSVGTTDPSGMVRFASPLQLSFSSVPNYHNAVGDRWGEYSSVSIDPDNPHVFWSVQAVPLDSSEWTTQISQIIVPEPTGCVGYVVVSLLLVLAGCRQRR